MKSLEKLGYEVKVLTFNNQGIKLSRKGYALMQDGKEIATLEPKYYPKTSIYYKDKYLLSYKGTITFIKSINEAVKILSK